MMKEHTSQEKEFLKLTSQLNNEKLNLVFAELFNLIGKQQNAKDGDMA